MSSEHMGYKQKNNNNIDNTKSDTDNIVDENSMKKSQLEYRASVTQKVNKIISDIDKLTKISLGKDYNINDIKQINEGIRRASAKMLKTLTTNLEDEAEFSFQDKRK